MVDSRNTLEEDIFLVVIGTWVCVVDISEGDIVVLHNLLDDRPDLAELWCLCTSCSGDLLKHLPIRSD